MSWQLFDRLAAFFKAANIYRSENLFQDQSSLARISAAGEFMNFSTQSSLLEQTNLQINRLERYKDFDQEDQVGEISLALDMYADESSLIDPEIHHSLLIKSKSLRVKKELEDLFYNTLMVDNSLRPMIRYLCKYGDFPAEIVTTQNRNGIASIRHMNVYNFTRVETKHGDLVGFFYQDEMASQPTFMHPWQVMHLRLTSYENIYHPYGRCCEFGAKILTPHGYKNIEDFKAGDDVFVFDDNKLIASKVTATCHSGEKEIFKISTRHYENNCSGNHPVLVREWSKKSFKFGQKWFADLVYKRADELKAGDELVIPRPTANKEHQLLGKLCDKQVIADENFAKLFGFLIGDGWLKRANGKNVGVTFANGIYDDTNTYYKELLSEYSPNKVTSYKNCGSHSILVEDQTNTCSKELANFLESKCGFIQGSHNKRIPAWIYNSPKSVQIAFIDGLIDSDGSVNRDEWDCDRYQLELSNYELIKDVKALLHLIGWKAGHAEKRVRQDDRVVFHGKEYQRSDSWLLYFYKSDIFGSAGGHVQRKSGSRGYNARKKESAKFGTDVIFEPITSIEQIGKRPTADIQVAHHASNFIADGVVVHNSILDGTRKHFKQLRLMEDAALIYRLCLRGDSRVWTPGGHTQIKDLKIGDAIYCYGRDGKLSETKVVNWMHNGKDKIYRIYSQHREIFANKTHPILVVDPYKKDGKWYYDREKFVDVQDLKALDNTVAKNYCHRFILPRLDNKEYVKLQKPEIEKYARLPGLVGAGTLSWSDAGVLRISKRASDRFLRGNHWATLKNADVICETVGVNKNLLEIRDNWSYDDRGDVVHEYDLPEVADEDFAQWFGFMIADGFVSERKHATGCTHEVGFALGDDKEINDKYKILFEKITRSVSFGRDDGHRLGAYFVYSKKFVEFMKLNGFIPGAANKRIPAWVYTSPRNVQEAFIDGYIDGDGWRRMYRNGKTEGHEVESCNQSLIEDLKELIHRIGWTAGLVRKIEKLGGHVIDHETGRTMPATICWAFYFTKKEAPLHERILGVEEIEVDDIYDITVEDEVHNFIANGIPLANTRAPEKRVFKIPVGNIPPKEVPQYIQLIAREFKKHKVFDPASGDVNERWSPLIQEDDIWLPKRADGTGPEVDTLPGAENLDQIADIEYFKKKMVSALKIPFSRVGIGEPSEGNSEPLSKVAPEFAKAVQWIQREVAIGLKKVAIIHLALRGFSADEIRGFDLWMTASSAIDELYRIETWASRADVIDQLKGTELFPDKWILQRFSNMTDDEIEQMQKEAEQNASAPKSGGGGGGGGGGGNKPSLLPLPGPAGLPGLGGPEEPGLGEPEELGLGEPLSAEEELDMLPIEGYDYKLEKEVLMEYNKQTTANKNDSPVQYNSPFEYLLNAGELDNLPSPTNQSDVLVKRTISEEEHKAAIDAVKLIITEGTTTKGPSDDITTADIPL
jgi:intein/homing endonuclease